MIFVLAGNHRLAHEWMQEQKLRHLKDATYVRSYETLVGIERNQHYFVRLSGWQDTDAGEVYKILSYIQVKGLRELDSSNLQVYNSDPYADESLE